MPGVDYRPVVVTVPHQLVDVADMASVLQKIDTAPIAPRDALADLTESEARLLADVAARTIRATLRSIAHTLPNPESSPSP